MTEEQDITHTADSRSLGDETDRSLATFRFEAEPHAWEFLHAVQALAKGGRMLVHDHVVIGLPTSELKRPCWPQQQWSPAAVFGLAGCTTAVVALIATAVLRTGGMTMFLVSVTAGLVGGIAAWGWADCSGLTIRSERADVLRFDDASATCTLLVSNIDERAVMEQLRKIPRGELVAFHSDLDAAAFANAQAAAYGEPTTRLLRSRSPGVGPTCGRH